MHIQVISFFTAATAAMPQVPLLNDFGELFGVQFTQPRLQLHGVLPFVISSPTSKSAGPGGMANEEGGNAEPSPWIPGPAGRYALNERGQFETEQAYAQALTEQLGLPPWASQQAATFAREYVDQALEVNKALSNFLGIVQNQLPDPADIARPFLDGVDAAGRQAFTYPPLVAAVQVLSSVLEGIASGVSAVGTVPADLLLARPQMRLEEISNLIEQLAPIASGEQAMGTQFSDHGETDTPATAA